MQNMHLKLNTQDDEVMSLY